MNISVIEFMQNQKKKNLYHQNYTLSIGKINKAKFEMMVDLFLFI